MGQWGRVQNKIKNALIYFQVPFLAVFVVFHNKFCVFIMMYACSKYDFFYDEEMSVRLYVNENVLENLLRMLDTALV